MAGRDPLHQKILEGLNGELNPQVFEDAVCDLLRDTFPTLFPVRGGMDAGMDGAIADGQGEAFPLIATTGKDVIGNLTKSLVSYSNRGGRRRKALLATSQPLTPTKRSNLEKRAREKGFELIQIVEQRGIADLLFRDADWRLKLLGISGTPSALSSITLSKRPQLELTPVGREAELKWLREGTGDHILSGQPGSGKTFLLQHLIRQGWPGLFLISRDETEIVDALRAQEPGFTVIVDDAFTEPDFLVRLRWLREETKAEFAILATTWPHSLDPVREHLGADLPVQTLEPLFRNDIVEIYHQLGIELGNDLMRVLVDQACNQPGLAATLGLLMLRGAWEEVLTGKALSRNLLESARTILGKEAAPLLAAFALGGEKGMHVDAVGEFLRLDLAELWRQTTRLAAGGILTQVDRNVLAVRPHQLRSALLGSVYFSEVSMPYKGLIDKAPSLGSAAEALAVAATYGIPVPDAELRELLLRADAADPWRELTEDGTPWARIVPHAESFDAWQAMALTSEANACWVVESFPGDVLLLADEILTRAPQHILPQIFKRLGGAQVGRVDPQDILFRWTKRPMGSVKEAMSRRRLLALEIVRFLQIGGDTHTGLQALRAALSPRLESTSRDPGTGDKVSVSWGLLPVEELWELGDLWTQVLPLLSRVTTSEWAPLSDILFQWLSPESAVTPGEAVPEETVEALLILSRQLIQGVGPLVRESPGLCHELNWRGEQLGLSLNLPLDCTFELLYPRELGPVPSGEPDSAALADLATRWSSEDPKAVAQRLVFYEREATQTSRFWPRHTGEVCRLLSQRVMALEDWLEAWSSEGLAAELAEPFLRRLVEQGSEGWDVSMERWLGVPSWTASVARLLAAVGALPPTLSKRVLAHLLEKPDLIFSLSLGRKLAPEWLHPLLSAGGEAAVAAAVGLAAAHPESPVPEDLREPWRHAILDAGGETREASIQFELARALAADEALAFDWLCARFASAQIPMMWLVLGVEHEPFLKALRALGTQRRIRLLKKACPKLGMGEFLVHVVGRDVLVFEALLRQNGLRDYHLYPLRGMPNDEWIPLARTALQAGWSKEGIAVAAMTGSHSWVGSGLEYWSRWDRAFAKLEVDLDPEIRAIGTAGRALVAPRLQGARNKEIRRAREGL